MSIKFDIMTKDEAIKYCYDHKRDYIRDGSTEREFDCLISILEENTITPSQLPYYGMDY